MLCDLCKGHGAAIVPWIPPECEGLVPEIQESLPDGSLALHYKNDLTAIVCFPRCPRCRGRGILRRSRSGQWVARWAARVGFRFPDAKASRHRGTVRRGDTVSECDAASGSI